MIVDEMLCRHIMHVGVVDRDYDWYMLRKEVCQNMLYEEMGEMSLLQVDLDGQRSN